jgi:membrane-bound serine protease (ClpP class)
MRWLRGLSVLLAMATLPGEPPEAPGAGKVVTMRLRGEAITPVTAQYLARGVQLAEAEGAVCVVVLLDTPGGLADSTREIVKTILGSRVPVVVYVWPPGARAASAGVFLTMAAHVAAMAPGTNIGAAHPVQIGGLPGPPQEPGKGGGGEGTKGKTASPMEDKIVNDTVAWARSLAELRGRNAGWAERAVRESISSPAPEAVREGAVDVLAADLGDLLRQIDGRRIRVEGGEVEGGEVALRTAGAVTQAHEMWWGERVLAAIANPTLALLLLVFGFYGVLFELYTPGWGVPGTVGAVCLILGFFALAVLPVNFVGVALIVIALAMFVAEAFVTSFGLLTLGGLACLITGGLMLVDSPAGFLRVSLSVLIPVALATAAVTVFLAGGAVRSWRIPVQTGFESMTGSVAIADEDFAAEGDHYTGTVRTRGELWRAVSETPAAAGEAVEILGREGLTLRVRSVNAPPGRMEPGPDTKHAT